MDKYIACSGIVEKRISRKTYLVKRSDNGIYIKIHLRPIHQMNYMELEIGATVYFELIPPDNIEGMLLTETNFKMR